MFWDFKHEKSEIWGDVLAELDRNYVLSRELHSVVLVCCMCMRNPDVTFQRHEVLVYLLTCEFHAHIFLIKVDQHNNVLLKKYA